MDKLYSLHRHSKTAAHVLECLSHAPGIKPFDVPYAMTVIRIFIIK